jgi:hypothetical protein
MSNRPLSPRRFCLPASLRDCRESPRLAPVRLATLAEGKCSTHYEHMRLLHLRGALRWRPGSRSGFMVVFPREGAFHFSGKLEMLNPPPMGEFNLTHTGDNFTAVRVSGKPDSGRSPPPGPARMRAGSVCASPLRGCRPCAARLLSEDQLEQRRGGPPLAQGRRLRRVRAMTPETCCLTRGALPRLRFL